MRLTALSATDSVNGVFDVNVDELKLFNKSNVIQRCLHSYRQNIVRLVSPQQILTQRKSKRFLNLSRNPIGLFPKMVRAASSLLSTTDLANQIASLLAIELWFKKFAM